MTTEVARVADHGRPRAPRAPRRGGRGRGGRAVNENTSRPESASQTNPVSQIPAQHTDTAALRETQGSAETSRRRRPRGRRGGNGGNGGRAEQTEQPATQRRTDTGGGDRRTPRNRGSAVVGGRKFGGQLTRHGATDEEGSVGEGGHQNHTEQDAGLRADAPEFVPGQTVAPPGGSDSTSKGKSKPTPSRSRPPKVTTKSTAEDITTRIHEDISHNLYECPICTNELGSKSRVWSCRLCWTVFHLSCIKKWSKNEGSAFRNDQQRQQDGEDETNAPRQWRCPGCNLPQDTLPTTYSCWCQDAHIRAIRSATQVPVLHVLPWARLWTVSAGRIHLRNAASRLTMSMDGAAVRSARTCCRAESIPAHGPATKDFVAIVR
ncbi:hypothetical protein DTO166G5_7279 [Paecilomyces variotii]|nr:hypothetical protein DTO166G5_7279 [Paecilomyces variotii]KAJ9252931.1 hypothetical protein DTO207G8_4451 [Paecilomyces variotii]